MLGSMIQFNKKIFLRNELFKAFIIQKENVIRGKCFMNDLKANNDRYRNFTTLSEEAVNAITNLKEVVKKQDKKKKNITRGH